MVLQTGTFTHPKIENTHILEYPNEMIKATPMIKIGIE